MNRRTMLGSCLGFLGAFLGLGVERDVIPIGYMTDKAGNKWRVCKPGRQTRYYRRIIHIDRYNCQPIADYKKSGEYHRLLRNFDRYNQQSARDFKELLGRA